MALNEQEMKQLMSALGAMEHVCIGGTRLQVNLATVCSLVAQYTDGTYECIPHIEVKDDPQSKYYSLINVSFEFKAIEKEKSHGSKSRG